jgi:hypothetical protein
MTQTTVPVGGTATSEYALTSGSAGSYTVVNVNAAYQNYRELICDKIELFPNGGSAIETARTIKAGDLDIRFYPSGSSMEIAFSRPLYGADLRVCDITGNIVWRYSGINGMKVRWDAGNVGSGIYFLTVKNNGKNWMKKLTVIR